MKILTLIGLLFLLYTSTSYAQSFNSEKLIEKCKSGVVYIKLSNSLGTGFLISENGHIVTNYHVIEGYDDSNDYVEFSDGKRYQFYLAGDDKDKDIALLQLRDFDCSECQVLPILPNKNGKTGIEVATIGHPKGLKFNITKGIISQEILHKEVPYMLRTDVAVNPGNSGGPLFNKNGQVVGIISARLEKKNLFDRDIQNLNFAINAVELRRFLQRRSIAYQTAPLIANSELSAQLRELSAEEVDAQKRAELQRIELEKQKEKERIGLEKQKEKERIELEKEKIRQQILESIKIDQLNAEQQKELSRLDFGYQKQILEQQRKLELQRIEEKQRRELLRLNSDEHELDFQQQKLRERKKQHIANLPRRVGFRIGGGAHYFAGTLSDLTKSYSLSRVSWVLTSGLTYRFDINNKDRGTSVGAFCRFGNYNATTVNTLALQQGLSFVSNSPINLFTEVEGGFLIKEWLRLSGGLGWQRINRTIASNSIVGTDFMYGVATLGFIARFGKQVALDVNMISAFALEYQHFSLRGEVCLVFRFTAGKW
ncbi:MAG: Trypsin-like serine protease with C-terminal PDZ domain [uncultured Aureispira sp.]|uniref:Trypsin-like serine protease with C-terminal PDZ domain n=1 Tax=uncultured Aureispira sp. TaxID=1331704 RepID=A0A6S6RSR1_9BACT|nr:MAG: Trypsin-like serine protease with C-terminal PDZ domain [uncultured Aureispira sp.]